ncbi:transposase [Rickettsia sp. TH2014]|uniref:transposase n=1 Tax=Rickettsia sp. TH2014 TaxID=1967503 RepID=UPI002113C553|nr:transposase [Rickettsia sp. TH2014]
MLKSHLNPKKREKIMVSIARNWELKGIEKGRQEGRRKEKIIIAKNLIKAGLKTDLIIASTGLKKEEIEKLQQTA